MDNHDVASGEKDDQAESSAGEKNIWKKEKQDNNSLVTMLQQNLKKTQKT